VETGFVTDDCRGLVEAATLLLLFCSARLVKPVVEPVKPVVEPVSPTDELPEQVSSEEELIDGNDLSSNVKKTFFHSFFEFSAK